MTRGRRVQFKIGKMENSGLSYEIQYTKAAEKFFKVHEDVRNKYELAVRELFVGDHPEKVDVKRIKGKRNEYYRMRIGDYRVVYALINGIIVVVKTMVAGARGGCV